MIDSFDAATFKQTIKQRVRQLLPAAVYGAAQTGLWRARAVKQVFMTLIQFMRAGFLFNVWRAVADQGWRGAWALLYSLRPQEVDKVVQALRNLGGANEPTASEPSVTIVLLSLDRWQLTDRCVRSLFENSDYPFQLLIFDNGSQEETCAYLRELERTQSNVRVVYHDKNLGVAGGRNAAFRQVETDYIMCLDNDVICHQGWLRPLMSCAARRHADLVSPTILRNDGRVWSCGADLMHVDVDDEVYVEVYPWFHGWALPVLARLTQGGEFVADFLNGCAALYRTEVFLACGGFPDYFVGWEDLDFSLTAAQQGYVAWVASASTLTHDHDWQPQSQADVAYVHTRYNIESLTAAAAQFEARWNAKVFPRKFETGTRNLIERKTGAFHES